MEGRRIDVHGTVQGVGFRPWVYRLAHELGIAGRVRNDAAGVTIEAFGAAGALESFVERLVREGPPASAVVDLAVRRIALEPAHGFHIVASESEGERRLALPADLATCDRCLAEVLDPHDRRHRYAFTNCTDCGPRFTISRDVPYDRPATTMAAFTMCAACAREYEDPTDRRFHAQPNACPACGPQLRLLSPRGKPLHDLDPLEAAAAALRAGHIVAIKGLGGYHLACDATAPAAVTRLRRRKQRETRPFAVLVADVAAARALAHVDAAAERLLRSVERPIVLLPRRMDSRLADEVAPDLALVGIMLPYTPLHHLLCAETRLPLVMTSGNHSGEPIAYRDRDALRRLGDLADLFLVHDRDIGARCDDSVARVVDGRPMVLRRSRGFVPAPIALGRRLERPILACGADLKNVVCMAAGDAAWLGPHGGDLEHLEAMLALEESVERMIGLVGAAPEIIAHDLHPGYASTTWASRRPEPCHIGVQHHHAHVAAVMAEHGLQGPVLGLAWDGTGYGLDGTAWGGELLRCEYAGFERVGTMRPLPLAGGDRAIHEPWRLALAALDDAYPEGAQLDGFSLFAEIEERKLELVRRMVAARVQAPLAHGVGRWFDAVGSLVLGLPRASYEGEIAMRWELAANGDEPRHYPFRIDDEHSPWQIDLRPMVRAVCDDVFAGPSTAVISARFHETLVSAATALIEKVARQDGRLPVVLAGGCFQNARLTGRLARRLRAAGFQVHLPSRVPPGDGGIALGQVVVADAVARRAH